MSNWVEGPAEAVTGTFHSGDRGKIVVGPGVHMQIADLHFRRTRLIYMAELVPPPPPPPWPKRFAMRTALWARRAGRQIRRLWYRITPDPG